MVDPSTPVPSHSEMMNAQQERSSEVVSNGRAAGISASGKKKKGKSKAVRLLIVINYEYITDKMIEDDSPAAFQDVKPAEHR